jgi:hypothetical protein
MMEALISSETPALTRSTPHNILEDGIPRSVTYSICIITQNIRSSVIWPHHHFFRLARRSFQWKESHICMNNFCEFLRYSSLEPSAGSQTRGTAVDAGTNDRKWRYLGYMMGACVGRKLKAADGAKFLQSSARNSWSSFELYNGKLHLEPFVCPQCQHLLRDLLGSGRTQRAVDVGW